MNGLNKNVVPLSALLALSLLWGANPAAAQVSSKRLESTKNKALNGKVPGGASSKDSPVTKSQGGTGGAVADQPKVPQNEIDYGGQGKRLKLSSKRLESIKNRALGPSRLASWTYKTKSHSGEFRHEPDGSWVEYKNGKPAFTFRETNRESGVITLFDDGRGLRVMLYLTTARVYRDNKVELTYTGGWQYKEWATHDRTVQFVNTEGKKWVEYKNGRQVFTFQEKIRSESQDVILLYDASRGLYVRLVGPYHGSKGNFAAVEGGEEDKWRQGGSRTTLTLRGTFTQ